MRTLAQHEAALTSVQSASVQSGDWRQASLCIRESPDDFFPIGHGPAAKRQAERAKRVCAVCPVRDQCLSWALGNDIRHGVFGGLDEEERRALVVERRSRSLG